MDDSVIIRNRFFLRLFKMVFFLIYERVVVTFQGAMCCFCIIFPLGFFLNDVDIFINTCMTKC